jgi:hypothetical protein
MLVSYAAAPGSEFGVTGESINDDAEALDADVVGEESVNDPITEEPIHEQAADSDSSIEFDSSDLGEDDSAEVVFQAVNVSELPTVNPIVRIRERLEDPVPLTWLFTGTDNGFDATKAKRSCVEFFSDFIKKRANRRLDVIVDSTYADHSLQGLNKNASWRVARFLPDVVFAMLSLSDLQTTNVESFGQSLYDFIVELQDEHCIVVLCTPAPIDDDCSSDIDSHLECIRRIAVENEVGLIDNFAYWTQTVDAESFAQLTNNERLTTAGHQKLTRTLLRSLGLLKS